MVASAVVCGVILGFLPGGLTKTTAWISLASGIVIGVAAFASTGNRKTPSLTAWDWLMLTVFAIASLRAFLWLIYRVGDEVRILSPYNLGDISLHIQFIRYLASGVTFWPESPILSGTPLVYPLGADLWNSLLLLIGVPLEQGLIWAGLFGATMTAWALWRWGGAFAIAALLFNGGLAGLAIFQTGQISDFQSEMAWKNIFLTMFVTQRGLLYALPCGLLLLRAWKEDFFEDGSKIPRWIQFLLYATLPLFNAHAFLFLSLTLASIFIFQPSSRRQLIVFVALALIPASIAAYFVTGYFSASSGLRWLPGWMQGSHGAIFWIANFGITLPLLAVLAWKGIIQGSASSRSFCIPALGVGVLCGFIAFAPWEWDNTKLMLWSWIACAPFLWELVLKPLPRLLGSALCVLLFFSGAVSLIGGLDGRHGYELTTRQELATARIALKDLPLGARIAIEPQFNHPAILLGYPVVCGYEGHLWSHGLKYRETWDKLALVLKQQPDWRQTAQEIGAKWVYLKGQKIISVTPSNQTD
jgi:hypothetical protein